MIEQYIHENTDLYGGLLPFKFDYMLVTSFDASDNPLIVEFYQNGLEAESRLVTTLTLTYNINGAKESVKAEQHIPYIERTQNIR